jgi:hypothetical protein
MYTFRQFIFIPKKNHKLLGDFYIFKKNVLQIFFLMKMLKCPQRAHLWESFVIIGSFDCDCTHQMCMLAN